MDQLVFADGERFQRRDRRNHDLHDLTHLLSQQAGPIAGARHDSGVHGGSAERDDGATPEPAETTPSKVRPRFYRI